MLQMAIGIFADVETFVVFYLLLLTSPVSFFFLCLMFDLLQKDMFDPPREVMARFPHHHS